METTADTALLDTANMTVPDSVITTDLQYRLTKAAARDFIEALARLDQTEARQSPEARALMRAAMESQLEDLHQQLAGYDARHRNGSYPK